MIHDARYGGGRGGDFWDARTRAHTHTHTHADTRARALTHTYNWQHTLSPAQRPRLLARLRMGGGGREGGREKMPNGMYITITLHAPPNLPTPAGCTAPCLIRLAQLRCPTARPERGRYCSALAPPSLPFLLQEKKIIYIKTSLQDS